MVEVINHIEQMDAAPIGKLAMHEVHRPALIDRTRHCQRQRFRPRQTMTRFDPQVQFYFAFASVDTLVAYLNPLTLRRLHDAQAKASVAPVVRQPYQPVGNEVVFRVQLRFVSVAGLASAKCLARQLDRG